MASGHSIRLGDGSFAQTLFAPAVYTGDYTPDLAPAPARAAYIEVLRPVRGLMPDLSAARNFQPQKLTPLGAETWVYEGSLSLTEPLLLRAKLVVRGSFSCPAGSLLEDDVKAGGDITVGANSICGGHLTAAGELSLAANCLFSGDVSAGLSARLGSGVRGFRQGGPVRVSATARILLGPNVLVRGELRSPRQVLYSHPETLSSLDLLLAHG